MPRKPSILISSSVYDKKELLSQVYAVLHGLGYEVWMSDKGTIPLNPDLTAFQNCLIAVENCDIFFGIISGYYGSGIEEGSNSITHQELSKAIELDKPRWLLVKNDVLVIRNFVRIINKYETQESMEICSHLNLRQHDPISDMRVLNMYDEATRLDLPLGQRSGNWVQPYQTSHDVLKFIECQLPDPSKYVH